MEQPQPVRLVPQALHPVPPAQPVQVQRLQVRPVQPVQAQRLLAQRQQRHLHKGWK